MKFSLITMLMLIIGLVFSCAKPEKSVVSPRFNHVILYVSDLDASIKFYTTAFDLKVTNQLTNLTYTAEDGSEMSRDIKIALLKFPGQDFVYEMAEVPLNPDSINTTARFQHVGVDVLDIEAAFQRVVDAGAEVTVPVRTVQANDITTKQAFLLGPDGELIELMQILAGEF